MAIEKINGYHRVRQIPGGWVLERDERDSIVSRCIKRLVRKFVPEKELYYELIWAVVSAYSGETRHQTALRYIQERECSSDRTVKSNATR